MYQIGEFSKIAQVSGRLLRYYDELDLLKPEHIDDQTGYRYYSATQLPKLNRILALKELGLTLDQIKRMVDDDVSPEELRGMLMMKKSQIEQMLQEEIARVRYIESRIDQINVEGNMDNYDIVLKSVPAKKVFGCPQDLFFATGAATRTPDTQDFTSEDRQADSGAFYGDDVHGYVP